MNFKELLYRARQGDEDAILEIFEMYRPLLIKNALVEGIFDEDLYQELTAELLKCIRYFRDVEQFYREKRSVIIVTLLQHILPFLVNGLHNNSYQLGNKKRNRNKNTRRNKQESLNIIKNKEGISMEMKLKECGIVRKEFCTEQIGKITEEEWR